MLRSETYETTSWTVQRYAYIVQRNIAFFRSFFAAAIFPPLATDRPATTVRRWALSTCWARLSNSCNNQCWTLLWRRCRLSTRRLLWSHCRERSTLRRRRTTVENDSPSSSFKSPSSVDKTANRLLELYGVDAAVAQSVVAPISWSTSTADDNNVVSVSHA